MQENSGLAAFGCRGGKVWAVALSCTLVCAQPGIVPTQALADESPSSAESSAPVVSYNKGDVLPVSSSNLVFEVTDEQAHEVSVGRSDGSFASGLKNQVFPEDHSVEIPEFVVADDDPNTKWYIKSIVNDAFGGMIQNGEAVYVSKITVNANLRTIGEKAFSGQNTPLEVVWNGTVETANTNLFTSTVFDTVEFPEGCLVTYTDKKTTRATNGYSNGNVVYPFSSYENVFELYGSANLFVKNPNVDFLQPQKKQYAPNNVYFWPGSVTQSNFEKKEGAATSYGTGRTMAILSADGYSFTAPESADKTSEYSYKQNVKVNLQDGQLFTGAPEFETEPILECTGDSDGKYSYPMLEGIDYNAVYFDAEGNQLNEKPTSAGDYSVQFVGNERASWGSTEKIKFSIVPSISGSVVTSDEDGAAYPYDGKAHAPAIKVTLGNYTLQEGVSYSVSYVGEDGELKSELPTKPGTYTALVISEQPSTGGVLGQVKFSIKAHQLQGGALSAANVEADADGGAVAPELSVTSADGIAVPAGAYAVSYKDADGNAVDGELTAAGSYTAVVTGDGVGCFGTLEAPFFIVAAGNSISSAEQSGSLEYSGNALVPQLKVTDKNDKEVSAENYTVTYVDKDGNPVAAADLKEIGTYTATVTAVGSQYVGSATCDVIVAAQDVADQVEVTLNRSTYDYQSTPIWFKDSYPSGNMVVIDRKSKAVDVDATVKLGDKVLTEGVDYVIKSTGDVTSSLEDGKSHEATFVVELQGNYSGTVSSDAFAYTVNSRIAKTYEYRGVKFSYAVNNDGTAVITGLGVDLPQAATQDDIAKAYAQSWDKETVTIPGTIVEADGTQRIVTSVSDCAFSLHSLGGAIDERDIWNGAKKLVIEKNIKEIGYGAMSLGTGYCNIEELSLPEGLEVIHSNAFGASKVKSIEIPASVTTIGSAAFGEHNGGNTKLESFTFAKGSKFSNHSEGYWQSSTQPDGSQIQIWKDCGEFLAGEGDHRDGDTLTKEVASPMSNITFPAGYTQANMVLDRFPSCTDYYFMGDSYPSDMKGFQIRGDAPNQKSEYRMWGWDIESTGLLNVFNMAANYGKNLKFRPFSVLGNTSSDTYKYTEAWNEETQASDGTKDYAANTFVGTPVVTNHGDEVTVDWNLDTKFVNSDYSWTPEEGTDFTVKYQKAGSTEQVDKITDPGTYTATLTGNGKTCFGTATATVQVDAATIAGAKVEVTDANNLVYTGAEQTPDVKVTLTQGEGESAYEIVLQPGTDYKVEYVNNVDATDSETHAVARVVGCGLYAGTVDGTFAIAKAPLSVTVANAAKTFGNDDPAFALSGVEGLVGGDAVVSAKFTREVGEVAGAYAIKCTGIDIKDKSGKRLVTDNYQVTYKDGTLAISGQAAVDISGDASEISPIADQVLYGSEVRPSVTVKVGGKELVEGADYVVSYKGNNAVGKATATVTGIGSYAGTKIVEFNVVKFVQFPDVQESDWFYGSVISAVRAGYMNGYENGLFGPNDTLTRGQAACVLANMAGTDGSVAYDGQYADVAGNEYYAANTAWAKKAGVMSGYAGTENFGPADNLTREQMACALYNYARDVDGKDVSVADAEATIAKFSDGDFVSGYATEAVAWAIEHGIMGNGGFINAQGDISRAEMAAMAVNYMTTVHED